MNLDELQKELVRFEVLYKELLDVLAVKQRVLDDYITSYYKLQKKTDWNCISLNGEFPEIKSGDFAIFVDVYINYQEDTSKPFVDIGVYTEDGRFLVEFGDEMNDITEYVTHWKYRPEAPVDF